LAPVIDTNFLYKSYVLLELDMVISW